MFKQYPANKHVCRIFYMHILEYSDYKLVPTLEVLLIKPIRELYYKDKTLDKKEFLKKMSVVYFYTDPRSTYNYITDELDRLASIIQQEGLPLDFTIDDELQEIIEEYKKHVITTSFLLLQDTKLAIDKVRKFLRDVDLTASDDKGKPLYTINSITQTIKLIPQLSKDLLEAERIITKEIEELGRAKGNQGNKTLMDDGILEV